MAPAEILTAIEICGLWIMVCDRDGSVKDNFEIDIDWNIDWPYILDVMCLIFGSKFSWIHNIQTHKTFSRLPDYVFKNLLIKQNKRFKINIDTAV